MRPISFLAMILLLVALVPPTTGADGDWPMWRHDPALTGYQPTPGAMSKEPRILARHFLGASPGVPTFADLLGSGRHTEVLILAGARLTAYDTAGKRLWECRPHGYVLDHVEWVTDLDGDGRNEIVALAGQMGGTRQAYLHVRHREERGQRLRSSAGGSHGAPSAASATGCFDESPAFSTA